METKNNFGLTGNQLKLLAVVTMTIDHIGSHLLPQFMILRIIGRLAFPIFAYMIAEGCTYTKNRKRYLGTMLILSLIFQLVYYFAMNSLYQCIFVTFSLSIANIYAIDKAKSQPKYIPLAAGVLVLTVFLTTFMPRILPGFKIDYRLFGVLLPVMIYFGRNKWEKLALLTIGLCLLSGTGASVQWYSLATVPILALYNGKRGRLNMKNFFYIYYPVHLVVIYLIKFIIEIFF